MVSTVITFSKADVQPPVYVAGSFTGWSPLEMKVNQTGNAPSENEFSYEADIQPGDHQYKFRLGPGDWWVLDESSPSADDGVGNINNILKVQPMRPKPSEPNVKEITPKTSPSIENNTVSDSPPSAESRQSVPVVSEEKTPTSVPANIGQKIVKEPGPKKEAAEVKSEKVNSQFDGHKDDPLPDIAPPPYSVGTETGAGLTPSSLKSEPATLEGTDGRDNARSGNIKSSAESKQSNQSWTDRLRSRNVALVIAVLVVPVAVSYLWYR